MINQHFFLPIFLIFIVPTLSPEVANVMITMNGSNLAAETSNNFICATLDWWPPEKCNYDQCPWGESSILNLNLSHPFLAKAIQAFNPLRVRLGGTLQDKVVYGMPNLEQPCLPFSKRVGDLFDFSEACLSMTRWDELNHLFQKTRAVIIFGLNALYGRNHIQINKWTGAWNSTNARDFISYSISKGYNVDTWEFGNELSGQGVGASVDAEQYAKDLMVLKAMLKELYNDSHQQPLLVAPGGFFDPQWYAQLLQDSGPGTLDAMTHHIYNLGGGDDPHIQAKIMDPEYLSSTMIDTFRTLQLTIETNGPWSSAWVGEAGGSYNSGNRVVSNKFLNSFWYLDQLGMASKYNTKVYCRQTLIGGNYGLLDLNTLVPNPDYYSALLWHRLMGKGVLDIEVSGSPYLRAYGHCRKKRSGISMLLINLSNSTKFSVTILDDSSKTLKHRKEYHLTAKDDNYLSQTMLLNGTPLELTEEGGLPPLKPLNVLVESPIEVAPLSIAFIVFPNIKVGACMS
ncbi:heparanase-like protein 2 [Zingiber officinale]|uniref:heparanase-like protein 2 n=1 Tax=Zingiber officinale TaxID=94328 RepID=UPI001C4B5CE4|nr:heparanase-like protein 2 [Zingiber officinale]